MTPEQEYSYIQQAQKDPRTFVHLYDAYFPRVHAYVRYRVHNFQDAEDIIAEVFLKAIRGLRGFKWRNRHSFAAWLFRTAHNLIVDYYRRNERVAIALDPKTRAPEGLGGRRSHALLPEEALTQQETFQHMRDLITTLSPRRQEVITLKFFGGLRNKEIADILDLDERTVASHLSRGLQDLRDKYITQTPMRIVEEVTA
jgi:RNA polymerase sigma-70 factor (ECF subfamily)